MKNPNLIQHPITLLSIISGFLLLQSCAAMNDAWVLPSDLAGKWKSETVDITVRTKENGHWRFTSDSAVITITINSNKTADGMIGEAGFSAALIKKNSGNPERTGVAYIIECGRIGKIFNSDPLDGKEVEIWLGPLKDAQMKSGLRFTEKMAQFPMAHITFRKL